MWLLAFIIAIPNRLYVNLFFLSCTLSGSGSFSFTGDNLGTASSPKAIKDGYAVYMSLKYKVFFSVNRLQDTALLRF